MHCRYNVLHSPEKLCWALAYPMLNVPDWSNVRYGSHTNVFSTLFDDLSDECIRNNCCYKVTKERIVGVLNLEWHLQEMTKTGLLSAVTSWALQICFNLYETLSNHIYVVKKLQVATLIT